MKRTLTLLLLLSVVGAAHGGDVARFTNLGFSADDRYFLFAQYGVDAESLHPFAELYLVDVPANRFVAGGVLKESFEIIAEAGDTGQGALFSLLSDNTNLVKKHSVDHLATGRLVYLHVDGSEPKELLSFRDFHTGTSYRLRLVQNKYGSGAQVSASFHLEVTITDPADRVRNFRLGLPDFRRKGVSQYRIHQVLISPGGEALIVVVEKTQLDTTGQDIRYMVETLRLRS